MGCTPSFPVQNRQMVYINHQLEVLSSSAGSNAQSKSDSRLRHDLIDRTQEILCHDQSIESLDWIPSVKPWSRHGIDSKLRATIWLALLRMQRASRPSMSSMANRMDDPSEWTHGLFITRTIDDYPVTSLFGTDSIQTLNRVQRQVLFLLELESPDIHFCPILFPLSQLFSRQLDDNPKDLYALLHDLLATSRSGKFLFALNIENSITVQNPTARRTIFFANDDVPTLASYRHDKSSAARGRKNYRFRHWQNFPADAPAEEEKGRHGNCTCYHYNTTRTQRLQ